MCGCGQSPLHAHLDAQGVPAAARLTLQMARTLARSGPGQPPCDVALGCNRCHNLLALEVAGLTVRSSTRAPGASGFAMRTAHRAPRKYSAAQGSKSYSSCIFVCASFLGNSTRWLPTENHWQQRTGKEHPQVQPRPTVAGRGFPELYLVNAWGKLTSRSTMRARRGAPRHTAGQRDRSFDVVEGLKAAT